jgi:methionyl aminopeptidase
VNSSGTAWGHSIHEDPKVPNFVSTGADATRGDFKLRPGMTLAVEPMVVAGRRDVKLLDDGVDGHHRGQAARRPL